jgi:cation-transporting P-type ATPase I
MGVFTGVKPSGVRHLVAAFGAVGSLVPPLKGVHWAEVNAVTAQVLVTFDEDSVNVADLVEAIEAVERVHGTHHEGFTWSDAPHPADDAPLISAATALGADVAGIAAAASGRFLRLPRIPPGIRAPLIIVESPRRSSGRGTWSRWPGTGSTTPPRSGVPTSASG